MPKLDITGLDRELRSKQIQSIYIITGPETHLAQSAFRMIKEACGVSAGDDVSLKTFSGKETRIEGVFATLRTVSMFGGRPVVAIREAESLSKDVLDALADYCVSPVESSTLVVIGEKLDGRTRFMQTASKNGTLIECKQLYMNQIPSWVGIESKRQGRQISQDAARFLSEIVGNDLGALSQSIERIILYIGEKKIIDLKDVEEAVAETRQRDVFELTDAVGLRQLSKAMSILHNVLENGESPILLLNMLARHFRILSKAKEISGRMEDGSQIAKYLGVHPYFAKNYLAQAKEFSKNELRASFNILHRCDRELKSSRVAKERIIEKALLGLHGLRKA